MTTQQTVPRALPLIRTLEADDAERVRLRRQWLLSPGGELSGPVGHDWPSLAIGHGYMLRHHPDTLVQQWGQAGDGIWLIGVVAWDRTLESIDFTSASARSHEAVVATLRHLAGMYVLVRVDAKDVHCYTDPAALMGLYRKGPSIASTPTLLGPLERDAQVDNEYPLQGTDDWYTGRLMPFLGVTCVLANHCVSLREGNEKRFWPEGSFEHISRDQGTQAIGALLQELLVNLSIRHPLLLSLTAGRDTRINLAACRGILDRVECFTLRGKGVHPRDIAVPGRLSERFGFAHRYVDIEPTPAWLDALYEEMTSGLVVGFQRGLAGGCRHLATDDAVHVSGNLGTTVMGYFWDSFRPRKVRMRSLLKEFVNKAPCIRHGVQEWLDSLPDMPAPAIYNLMYMEQRGGRWMSLSESTSQIFFHSFTPFCSRVLFELLSGMPVSSQHGSVMLRELVDQLWPELWSEPLHTGTKMYGRAVPKRLKVMLQTLRQYG